MGSICTTKAVSFASSVDHTHRHLQHNTTQARGRGREGTGKEGERNARGRGGRQSGGGGGCENMLRRVEVLTLKSIGEDKTKADWSSLFSMVLQPPNITLDMTILWQQAVPHTDCDHAKQHLREHTKEQE